MISIFRKIKIHLLFYVLAIICILTGFFKQFLYLFLLIFIHELGHAMVAMFYKWNIEKIKILPFGGVTVFKENLNKPIKEEFIILISGPIFQLLFYFLVKNYVSRADLLKIYNYSLLLFNYLPIIPLDGGRLLNLVLNKITSFKKSHILTVYISYVFLFGLVVKLFTKFNLVFILILLFVTVSILNEHKIHNLLFNKFLLERRIYNFFFKKKKVIYGYKLKEMKRDYSHLFYVDNKYYTEKEILRKKFDFNKDV